MLPLSELLAVRRCAEPSLPEGAGIWVSTQAMPTVSLMNDAVDSRLYQSSSCCCHSVHCMTAQSGAKAQWQNWEGEL